MPSAAASVYAAGAERLEAMARTQPRLSVLTPAMLAAWYPVAEPHDIVGDQLGHLPYTEQLFCALGAASARGVLPTLAPSSAAACKCIAVDCDFTLWHGAVGEAGVDGIVVEPRHAELQERLLALRARGVLLALLSRNAPEDVWRALEQLAMPLRRHHVVAARIDPLLHKAPALAALAAELRIGVESILFIDDNPSEVADVRAALPEVATWTFPQSHALVRAQMPHVWQLGLALRAAPTEADVARVASYEAEALRRADIQRVMEEQAEGGCAEEMTPTASDQPIAGSEAAGGGAAGGGAAGGGAAGGGAAGGGAAGMHDQASPLPPTEAMPKGPQGGVQSRGAALAKLHDAMQVKITFEELDGGGGGGGGGRSPSTGAMLAEPRAAGGDAGDRAPSVDRILQLLERTNQFNCWKRPPPSPAALAQCEGVAMTVADRYASYGLVGIALGVRQASASKGKGGGGEGGGGEGEGGGGGGGESDGGEGKGSDQGRSFRVLAFAMSCRVLGRGAEHAMLARLGALASRGAAPCDNVLVGAVPSARNQLARRFLARADAQLGAAGATGAAGAAAAPSEAPGAPQTAHPNDGEGTVVLKSPGGPDDWLGAEPALWHRYLAADLACFTFDPAAEADCLPPAEDGEAASAEGTADAPGVAHNGSDHDGALRQRVAAALSRMPSEGGNVEQLMRRHGYASAVLGAGGDGSGGGAQNAKPGRDGALQSLRSIWRSVLGDRLDEGESPLLDDVPFAVYGGDSVLAVQVLSLASRHGLPLPHELANRLEQMSIAQLVHHLPPTIVSSQGATSQPPANDDLHAPVAAHEGGAYTPAAPATPSAAPLKIIERDSRVPTMPLRPIGGLSACAAGDLPTLQRLAASAGWQPAFAADKHGNTALMWAAGSGHLEVVRWLLESMGVAVDSANKDGRTALMWSCKNCHREVVRYLLAEGSADVTLRMKDDSNAFDWAVLGGDEPTMEMLAAHPKVDIAALNKFGCAAVQWAAAAGNVSTCRWLQAKGIDLSHVNTARHGAIVKAAWKGHVACLRWLLHDPDGPKLTWQLQMRDLDGRTVAELARMNGQHRTADWLQPLIVAEDEKGAATLHYTLN
jgi:HAD superfamily phosphatase (TIGR01681 family)